MSEPRSWLFVPADSEKKVAKAIESAADAGIFDLDLLIYITLWALAAANTQTVIVRSLMVARQARAEDAAAGGPTS